MIVCSSFQKTHQARLHLNCENVALVFVPIAFAYFRPFILSKCFNVF